VWQRRFDADPAVVGSTVRLGDDVHTVVGVMPEGFAFPMQHAVWTPLRVDPLAYGRLEGPPLQVFGRLAAGATRTQAQTELTAIGRRMAAAFPELRTQLDLRIVHYAALFDMLVEDNDWRFRAMKLVVTLLLVVVGVNVAVLVYARTATRQGEIAIRSALGASRRRIVAQLFAEALVLALAAAALGLVVADVSLRYVLGMLRASGSVVPFWFTLRLTPGTVIYVAGLTALAAVIVGVVPGLGATGRGAKTTLSQLSGATGLRLGRTWTAMIVAQVAIAVAVLPGAVGETAAQARAGFGDPGFPAGEFMTARILLDDELSEHPSPTKAPPSADRFGALLTELERRLEADPTVAGVTATSRLPGVEQVDRIEVEGMPDSMKTASGWRSRVLDVAPDFFDVFGVPVLAGRGFRAGDADATVAPVLVSATFAREILGGRGVVGRHIRFVPDPGDSATGEASAEPWQEIVGVVADLPPIALNPTLPKARLYRPAAPGQIRPAFLVARTRGVDAESLATRFQEVTPAVDRSLLLQELMPLDDVYRTGERGLVRLYAVALVLTTASVLLLSAAGMYALMSLAVTRRRREIGIRSALGAEPMRILGNVLSRALGQLAFGGVLGIVAAVTVDRLAEGDFLHGHAVVLLAAATGIITTVGLGAALGPARRGLRIQPTEALRGE
jgi:predicted permease